MCEQCPPMICRRCGNDGDKVISVGGVVDHDWIYCDPCADVVIARSRMMIMTAPFN